MNSNQQIKPTTPRKIACCLIALGVDHFGVSPEQLDFPSRGRSEIALARQSMMTAIYQLTGLSLRDTALLFRRRNHGTVIHARCRIIRLLAQKTPQSALVARYIRDADAMTEDILKNEDSAESISHARIIMNHRRP